MRSEDDEIAASVDAHGWHAIGVEASSEMPALVYTIGLCRTFDHPEVMVFGIKTRIAHSILADLVTDIKAGKSYASSDAYTGLLDHYPVAVRRVHPTQHVLYLGYTMAYYRRLGQTERLVANQLFWPDKSGQFPFQTECDPAVVALQPRADLAVPPAVLKAFMEKYGLKN